jgi:hypothetical protein
MNLSKLLGHTHIIVGSATTLTLNQRYYIQPGTGSYTLTLPTPVAAGDFLWLHFGEVEDDNVTLDGNGTDIMADDELVVDISWIEFNLVYDGTEWTL